MEHITLGTESSSLQEAIATTREASKKNGQNRTPDAKTVESSPSFSGSPEVTFDVDTESGRIYIHVVDPESGETVREIPPEALRKLAEVMDEISGRLVNTSA